MKTGVIHGLEKTIINYSTKTIFILEIQYVHSLIIGSISTHEVMGKNQLVFVKQGLK